MLCGSPRHRAFIPRKPNQCHVAARPDALFVSIRRGLGYETDVVSVARNRGFRNLRLDVKNRAITLNWIKVIYADGSSDVFAERLVATVNHERMPVLTTPPERLQRLNFIHFYAEPSVPGFGYGLARLNDALKSDLEWLTTFSSSPLRATATGMSGSAPGNGLSSNKETG